MICAAITLAVLGLVCGGILAFAAKKFAVELDPKVEEVARMLPNANCGACGFPGCASFAQAVVDRPELLSRCAPGQGETVVRIAEFLGVKVEAQEPRVARILCNGDSNISKIKFRYEGLRDCRAAVMMHGGFLECGYGCLGLGTCMAVCPFSAITMNEKGRPEVDTGKCTGCGKCVEECPQKVIELVPARSNIFVKCRSRDKGKTVQDICAAGCIGCKVCEKKCPFDAIKVEDNLARIDYEKCRQCGVCVKVCPKKCIVSDILPN